jgi:hypothetical protein
MADMTRIVILSEAAAAIPTRPECENEPLLQGKLTPEQENFATKLKTSSPTKVIKIVEYKVRARTATLTRNLAAKGERLLESEGNLIISKGELVAAKTEADALREELAEKDEQLTAKDMELEATRQRMDRYKVRFNITLAQKRKLLSRYAKYRVEQADAREALGYAREADADAADGQAL